MNPVNNRSSEYPHANFRGGIQTHTRRDSSPIRPVDTTVRAIHCGYMPPAVPSSSSAAAPASLNFAFQSATPAVHTVHCGYMPPAVPSNSSVAAPASFSSSFTAAGHPYRAPGYRPQTAASSSSSSAAPVNFVPVGERVHNAATSRLSSNSSSSSSVRASSANRFNNVERRE